MSDWDDTYAPEPGVWYRHTDGRIMQGCEHGWLTVWTEPPLDDPAGLVTDATIAQVRRMAQLHVDDLPGGMGALTRLTEWPQVWPVGGAL